MPMVPGIIPRRLGTRREAISTLSYSAIKGKNTSPSHSLPNLLLLNYYVREIAPFRKATGKPEAHSRGSGPSPAFPPLGVDVPGPFYQHSWKTLHLHRLAPWRSFASQVAHGVNTTLLRVLLF